MILVVSAFPISDIINNDNATRRIAKWPMELMLYTIPFVYLGMKMNEIYQDKPSPVFTFIVYYINKIKIGKVRKGMKT